MKFQFQSDIHLEVGNQYNTYEIPPSAPYLILAGDIGNLNQYDLYKSFLQIQCQNFAKVFLVLGNHEFYNITRQQGVELAERLTKEQELKDKLVLLHRQRYDFDEGNVALLGCTLNSHIQEQNKLMVRMKVSDFSKIKDWTPDMHNAEHDLDSQWLRDEIGKIRAEPGNNNKPNSNNRKILVITHHVPFRQGCAKPEHENTEWHDAFATDLLSEAGKNVLLQADAWIFGHTHYTTSCRKGGVLCLANQRGYVFPWETEIPQPNEAKESDSSSGTQQDKSTSSSFFSASGLLKKIIKPNNKKQTPSFKVKYPGPRTGNQGDGDLSFDPTRCIDI